MLFAFIIIGLIQGLTEFLPVSSSGHIVLATKLFNLNVDTLFLTIFVHMGTLLAVIIVYRKRLWEMIRHPFTAYTFKILISTLITVICYLIFGDMVERAFGGEFLVYGFVLSAIVLIASDLMKPSFKPVGWGQSVVIGFAQGLALFPAVSRSGMTICASIFAGVGRSESADYSFILSVPVILGSSILEIPHLTSLPSNQIFPLICAFIVAFVSGILAIKLMISAIKKAKLSYFAFYLIILSIVLIALGYGC